MHPVLHAATAAAGVIGIVAVFSVEHARDEDAPRLCTYLLFFCFLFSVSAPITFFSKLPRRRHSLAPRRWWRRPSHPSTSAHHHLHPPPFPPSVALFSLIHTTSPSHFFFFAEYLLLLVFVHHFMTFSTDTHTDTPSRDGAPRSGAATSFSRHPSLSIDVRRFFSFFFFLVLLDASPLPMTAQLRSSLSAPIRDGCVCWPVRVYYYCPEASSTFSCVSLW